MSKSFMLNILKLFAKYMQTFVLVSFLVFIIAYFYIGGLNFLAGHKLLNILFLSILTDGIFLLLHLPRRPFKHKNLSFDPKKLTVVIACYNGADIIGRTIEGALTHVPANQIIVVSDASKDKTVEVAKAYGVRVVENKRNVNKAFSISFVMNKVKTPYVLILDDDTLIEKTFIPTSLLDDGYDAVAFNVMPAKTGTLVNKLQMFEYRKSMFLGKSLRASVGGIGNVSGAIGLYRTEDLIFQATRHSGQFGGEDQQRTALVHLYRKGKGVTYTDSKVITKAPDTIRQLFKQRSLRWNLSLPELFVVYIRLLIDPNTHYLLKFEMTYQIYVFITDPMRMLLFLGMVLTPINALIIYVYYLFITTLMWLKVKREDPFWIVLIFPLYKMCESVCRFIAQFYWFKIKYRYLFKEKYYKFVSDRKLIYEYSLVVVLMIVFWTISMVRLKEEISDEYTIYITHSQKVILASNANPSTIPVVYHIPVAAGDGRILIARKAINDYLGEENLTLTSSREITVEENLQKVLNIQGPIEPGQTIDIEKSIVKAYIEKQ